MKSMYFEMLFIGYGMMFIITLFLITGHGDPFSYMLWYCMMWFFAVSGIHYREIEMKASEVLRTIENTE